MSVIAKALQLSEEFIVKTLLENLFRKLFELHNILCGPLRRNNIKRNDWNDKLEEHIDIGWHQNLHHR